MELSVQSQSYHFLRNIVQEVRFQEETAEMIVPDSCPDIGTIVDAYAGAILRGKDCRDGSVSVSGGVKGGILYLSEDGTPHVLEFYLPFNTKIDHPELTSHSNVLCDVRIQSVDGRIINSRKAMLRVNLGFYVDGYEQETETCSHPEAVPDWMQVLKKTYPLHLPLAYDEKSFSLHDVADTPDLSKLYKLICRPEVTEQKILGNKAVFKGTVQYKAAYLTQEGQLRIHTNTIPFSQYCQMEQEFDEDKLSVIPIVTGFDWTTEGEGTGKKGEITVHILVQCVVSGTRELSVIEDAYSLNGTLEGEWKEFQFQPCLDRQKTSVAMRPLTMEALKTVLDTEFYPGFPELKRESDQVCCEVPIQVRVIGRKDEGILAGVDGIGIAEFRNPICVDATCMAWISSICSGYGLSAADTTEVRGEVLLDWKCIGGQPIKSLCSCKNIPSEAERPAAVLRYLPEDSLLWDLAKSSCAKASDIQAFNHLEGEFVPAGRLLLVPVG